MGGFWWLYAPLQFGSFGLIVILQENPDGNLSASTLVPAALVSNHMST